MNQAAEILTHAAVYLRQSYKPKGLNHLLWDGDDAEAMRLLFILKSEVMNA